MHFFDGIDDAAHDFFRVGGAKGAVGAVDGGLDYRVGIFDRFDEGGMRRGVALGDMEEWVVAQLGWELRRVTDKGCDVVLLAEACCDGGRADPAWKEREACQNICCSWVREGEHIPAAPMIRIFMDVSMGVSRLSGWP